MNEFMPFGQNAEGDISESQLHECAKRMPIWGQKKAIRNQVYGFSMGFNGFSSGFYGFSSGFYGFSRGFLCFFCLLFLFPKRFFGSRCASKGRKD